MCEQTEINYLDGEVVWVKLGSCWWPGEVVASEKLPPDVLPSFRKPPIAVVKFFQEDTYEYVKNINLIYKYNCSRKNEFINKGLSMCRTKHALMEKFPEDIVRAETAVGGDVDILNREEFQECKKDSPTASSAKKKFDSGKKGKGGKGKAAESPRISTPNTKVKEKTDYKVHILVQGAKSKPAEIEKPSSPISSIADIGTEPENKNEHKEEESPKSERPVPILSTPVASNSSMYSCHACSFTTTRLNVLILHNKTHSASFIPYTPSPIRSKVTPKSSKSTPKTRRPRKNKIENPVKKSAHGKKRAAEEPSSDEVKKPKTDEEIKSSLLADWDDVDEESNDESATLPMVVSPEVPAGAESPAVPTPAEQPSGQIPGEKSPVADKSNRSPSCEKPESSSDSKYEFCEDEDWPLEADVGRKIPRVKNAKRKEESKSLSLDEDDVSREVADLLNRTSVPELPAVPEPLKVEENFPEPSIVKSPDKNQDNTPEKLPDKSVAETQPTKAIFKTKTFFRSRHSRSQDAIGKYVAEQLNAVERMDITDNELNGSDVVSSPEARESPPIIEQIKVARLAPKIQLKKLKAEAAQLREKERLEQLGESQDYDVFISHVSDYKIDSSPVCNEVKKDSNINIITTQDVLYPTQEIKPVNTDLNDKLDKHFLSHGNIEMTPVDDIDKILEEETNTSEALAENINKTNSAMQEIENIADTVVENTQNSKVKNPETTNDIAIESYEPPKSYGSPKSYEPPESYESPESYELPKSHNPPKCYEPTKSNVSPKTYETPIAYEPTKPNKPHEPPNSSEPSKLYELSKSYESPKSYESAPPYDSPKSYDSPMPDLKFPETSLQKHYEQSIEPYMNESTASAVDALLSVSREADRVTRVISDDPPEDLFEDDNKDSGMTNSVNSDYIENDTDEISQNGLENNALDLDVVQTNEVLDEKTFLEHAKESLQDNLKEPLPMLDDDIDVKKEEPVISTKEETYTQPQNDIELQAHSQIQEKVENVPSESDLQIAEALINLPSTAIQNKKDTPENVILSCLQEDIKVENKLHRPEEISNLSDPVLNTTVFKTDEEVPDTTLMAPGTVAHAGDSFIIPNNENNLNIRFETEKEKSENLNAAQSLVEMSESIDHKINVLEANTVNNKDIVDVTAFTVKQNNGIDNISTVEQQIASLSNENKSENTNSNSEKYETSSSKLLKILEEPCVSKISTNKAKHVASPGKEKILNFDVAKSSFKEKQQSPKQKIIIRRAAPSKNIINNMNEITTSDKIILSRSNNSAQDGPAVQTYTIQTTPECSKDQNTIIIKPKLKKMKSPTKMQKIKTQNSVITPISETKTPKETQNTDESIFDINSMPVVLSEDLITPESIEKMPIVMSDANIITSAQNPPKLVKTKHSVVENDKVIINTTSCKPEVKTLLMNPVSEVNKVNTPNILSKSSKLRGAKPMLVIDKTTGKQKIIMTKSDPPGMEVKQSPPTLIQAVPQTAKADKLLILPSASSPRTGRAQKIVIDPQTGKAHVLVAKGPGAPVNSNESKPVSAKLISSSENSSPTNTVMIITNAQGAQSRILLTPEHEKILFPNKQQPNISQLKQITQRINANTGQVQKSIITTTTTPVRTQTITQIKTQTAAPVKTQAIPSVKTPTRIVPKQKSAIITSKGQLIVGGRVATTAQNIAPMPEIRPVPKRIIASEPKKLVQTIQKTSPEPLIFLQQKSGAVMQLTAAQFEHLQRTGQIVQKTPTLENKITIQKTTTTVTSDERLVTSTPKSRIRKATADSIMPAKKAKQEIAIAPAPLSLGGLGPPLPALAPLAGASLVPPQPPVAPVSSTVSVAAANAYSEFDNFEDMLPSTAIVRQQEVVPPAEITPLPTTTLSDSQLLAVPGEHFGGPPGSFYLCVEDNGTLTPIDNRPLVLENNQLVPMTMEPVPVIPQQPERRDILEAALANSDVFQPEPTRSEAPDFRDLNANVSVHCRVSETSTVLNQPIMTPVEVPTKMDVEPAVTSNLEAGLAVIGVTPHTVPTSLELPITVTDPRIALKTSDPLSGTNYGPALLTSASPSGGPELSFVTNEEEVPCAGPISMPLLTEEEGVGGVGGKSMPILTDEGGDRSSADSASGGSPASLRRLLTPCSDSSEASAEIPLQPPLQFSISELARHN